MILWSRWEQCKNCYNECGWDEPVGLEEELIMEHIYECKKGEVCDSDFKCDKFVDED